jgi:hypothetical protein
MLDPQLREKLLAQEEQTPALKERYEKEIQTMIEKPLSKQRRIAYSIVGVVSIIGFCVFAYAFYQVAFAVDEQLPLMVPLTLAVGAVAALVWAGLCFNVARKGSLNIKKDAGTMTGVIWMVVVVSMVANLMMGMEMEDAASGARMILYGLVFLVMGALFMIQNWIERMKVDFKESVLRLELQVAEMNEKIKGASEAPTTKNTES